MGQLNDRYAVQDDDDVDQRQPKRFKREKWAKPMDVESLHLMAKKSVNRIIGNPAAHYSKHKPKLHDRSFKLRDLNGYLEKCKKYNLVPLDINNVEFFDHIVGTSMHKRPIVELKSRDELYVSQRTKRSRRPVSLESQTRRRSSGELLSRNQETSFTNRARVAPSLDDVDGDAMDGSSGKSTNWIIKSRSYLKRQQRENQRLLASRLSRPPPKPKSLPVPDVEVREEPDGGENDVDGPWVKFDRVAEVTSKESNLFPIPPKLSPLEKHKKSGVGAIFRPPGINDVEEEAGVDEPDAGDGDNEMHEDEDEVDGKAAEFVKEVWDNSDRASIGMKLTRRCFGFSTTATEEVVKSRPFFTVWITIIQAIVYLVIIGQYGIAPIGVAWTSIYGEVLMTDLSVQYVSYLERSNLWIGPRESDLIHLGAKFAPCMRTDNAIQALLQSDRNAERQSGCCINYDGSGCVQTSYNECPTFLAVWKNQTVCGEDPEYCDDPPSIGAYTWSTDITQWPVCLNTLVANPQSDPPQMTCSIVGRPCCVGVLGECVMATREYCDFRRGYFHENQSLCSQVSCINEVCGMISFTDPEKPDQYYRFFTSLCIHPGLLALVMTQVFQWFIQYDLERYIGWWAMATIYVVSGYCGSIMSAIFIPYFVEAGPSGSQFGVLAAMSVEIVRWNAEESAKPNIAIIFLVLMILFIVGLIVPQVDNWSHLAGYIVGILLAIGFRPVERFGNCWVLTKTQIVVAQVFCFLWVAAIAAILTAIFYTINVVQCDNCEYFNCIPFSDTYCTGMASNLTSFQSA